MRFGRIYVLCIALFLMLPLAACGDDGETVTREVQFRDGMAYLPGDNEPFTGKHMIYYPNGHKKTETTYFYGRQFGIQTQWYESGKKQSEGEFRDGRRYGRHSEWYENGQIRSQTQYYNDQKHGMETIWFENGQKRSEIHYAFNQKDGPARGWYQDGRVLYEDFYRRGRQVRDVDTRPKFDPDAHLDK